MNDKDLTMPIHASVRWGFTFSGPANEFFEMTKAGRIREFVEMPAGLVTFTVKAATEKLATGGVLTAQAAALSKGAINMLAIAKLKTAAAVVVTATILVGGGTAVVQHVAQAEQQESATEQVPEKLNDEIKKMIRQLGDSKSVIRERASARLLEIGEPALPALQAAVDSPDAEVVVRANELLSRIRRKPIDRWIERLREPAFDTDRFLANDAQRFIDSGEFGERQPPLLDYYRKAFGDEKNAREYYVALLRKKPGVFVIGQNYLNASPPDSQREQLDQVFVELLEIEVEQISQDQRQRSKAEPSSWRGEFHDDVAAVMIVHAATEPELSAQTYSSLRFRIKTQSKPRDASTAKGRIRNLITKNDLQKKMLRPVLEHCWLKVTTARATWCGMDLFASFGWNQSALKLARRTVELAKRPAFSDYKSNPDIVGFESYPLQAQFLAAHHLLLFGEQEDIPVAAQLLKQDGTVRVIARPPGIPRGPHLEVRELALMALAKLNKQKPEDFGMKENKVYCPVAQTAKAFYLPEPGNWPEILKRFLTDAETDEGSAEEAKSNPQK